MSITNTYNTNIIYSKVKTMFNIVPKGIFYICSNSFSPLMYNIMLDLNSVSFIIYFMWSHINIQTKMFSDLLISDYPNYKQRFLSIYNIVSLVYNFRIIFKVLLNEIPITNTITNIYTCASWFEREAWDLFGVFFFNNVDLRRILNDYGFNGHPLKKDFPLSGFTETIFNYILGIITYDYVQMTQEFRFFNINSPWKYNLNVNA